jgi:methionyl-tRNA formyltransferase
MKAIILCNNPIALPAIKEFLFFDKVAAFIVPRRNKEMTGLLKDMIGEAPVPVITVDRHSAVTTIAKAISTHQATVALVMTFPYILPASLLQMSEKGFINFHFGLLPQCRGSHPIFWHILNNDQEAGITVHLMDEGVDTGPVIQQFKVPITDTDTYGILQSKLAYEGARAAANLFKILSYGSMIPATPQDESLAAYYGAPQAQQVTLRFAEMDATLLLRTINACNPWNKGAAADINGWRIGITAAQIITDAVGDPKIATGTITAIHPDQGLLIKTRDNHLLRIDVIYLQEGFFPGWRLAEFGIKVGDQFT